MFDPSKEINYSAIVDIDGLCEFLSTTRSNLRNQQQWRKFPHVFVGIGKDLKAARFNVADVWEYLTANHGQNYGNMENQENGKVGLRVPASESAPQKGRILKPVRRNSGRGKTKGRGRGPADSDPFNLIPGDSN